MKSTEHFKTVIQSHLEQRATWDELFALTFAKPTKNIDNCINYILNTVQKSGCNGFSDDEIFSIAVHYYDEDNIEAGKSIDCQVVVNHTIELTENEKTQARQQAIKKIENEAYAKLKQQQQEKAIAKRTLNTPQTQASLFDF